jgi:hypothetical protein
MDLNLRIRGIYSTALTKFFMDHQINIVDPSEAIAERFDLGLAHEIDETKLIRIKDRRDKQGILIEGSEVLTKQIIELIRKYFKDAVIRRMDQPKESEIEGSNIKGLSALSILLKHVTYQVEFPYESKGILDQLRGDVVPTLKLHHRLKSFISEEVDKLEEKLLDAKGEENFVEEFLQNFLYKDLRNGMVFTIKHVKPEGKEFNLTGKIIDFERKEKRLLLKRIFKEGTYDGLNIPKENGDFGITELKEGSWLLIHSYYSREGELKGKLYNINTPIELYPTCARYIDLHVDVIEYKDGTKKMIDVDELQKAVQKGFISKELATKAIEKAEGVL